jgi:hypothetical protein
MRFNNVLRNMMQENFMHEDESDSDTDENRLYRYKLNRTGPGFNRMGFRFPTPKRGTKSSSLTETPKPQPSFVMKLFDRGVDLAQFDETTPLYPICRAWMHNKPHNARTTTEPDNESVASEQEYREEGDDVYRLPPPEPLPVDEYGNPISIRIPPPLPRTDEEFDINYNDEDAPSPALLFQNHLDRWNLIRQRWKEAAHYNERRYENSFAILRQIHERSTNAMAPPPAQ